MQKQLISPRQLAWLLTTYIITTAMLTVPQLLTRVAGSDAWLFQIFPIIYGLLICSLFFYLARRFPGKNLFDINLQLAGRLFGSVLNLVLLLNIWFILTRDVRYFTFLLKTTLLPRTPEEILLFLFVIVLIYYGQAGIEVTARVNELLLPLLLLLLITVPFLLANEISIRLLEPFFSAPLGDLFFTIPAGASYLGDFLVAGFFLHTVANQLQLKTAIRHGFIQSAVVLMYVMMTSIAVFGSKLVSIQNYPTYQAVAQVHITDFLDRVELFEFAIFFPAFILNTALSFIAILIGIASFTQKKDYRLYSKAAGWLIIPTVYFAFRNNAEGYRFTDYSFPLFVLLLHPLYYLLVLLLAAVRQKKGQRALPPEAYATKTGNDPDKQGGLGQSGGGGGEGSSQQTAGGAGGVSETASSAAGGRPAEEIHASGGADAGSYSGEPGVLASENRGAGAPDAGPDRSGLEGGGNEKFGAGGPGAAPYGQGGSSGQRSGGAPGGGWLRAKKPLRVYTRRTTLLVVLALVFLVVGFSISYSYQGIARICSLGFFLTMLALYISSKQELMAVESD
ncbi:hypothetical protein J31TS4_32780 [Paenibacillus sp. J31TS4]|uniref:GerAB/ArcD/ProY family transporter n=1 Tax=Paenibacillus sp. J31TS4 TaxID=2807195 RepID=UPI001B19951F|nr:endospore germination permease [Paenibacillus sp. J31TS4]GIP39998.1 hypothetical protein J31TS4_32780 [Paenibacillus sp. J31TS4]